MFCKHKSVPNLAKHQQHGLDYLRLQQDFIIAHCDKNLGPAIIERDKYIRLAFRDHLSDNNTYQRFTFQEAKTYCYQNRDRILRWINLYSEEIGDQATKYLQYHLSTLTDPLPYFYLLMKVHKTPLKT